MEFSKMEEELSPIALPFSGCSKPSPITSHLPLVSDFRLYSPPKFEVFVLCGVLPTSPGALFCLTGGQG
uniref:Uncharacterized protein n=1 Tax=Oryza nivara TaxID=4536 RepID=A0A0E0FPR1_ORYNI